MEQWNEKVNRYENSVAVRRNTWAIYLSVVITALLAIAMALLPKKGHAQVENPEFRKKFAFMANPKDTPSAHADTADLRSMMYFVDLTEDNVPDYYSYDLEAYQHAKTEGFPTFAAVWPRNWEYGYEHGVLILIPPGTNPQADTMKVSVDELWKREEDLQASGESIERCGTNEKELSLFLPKERPALPLLTIVTSYRVRLIPTRDRFTSEPDFDQGPRDAVEAVLQ